MDPVNWQKIKVILSTLLDAPEAERPNLLAGIEDELIRFEVEKLLLAHGQADKFIEIPILFEQGFSEEASTDPLIGKCIENYLIEDRIGSGGMGSVYLATRLNSDFKQKVAVKLIKRGMDSEAIQTRFSIERRILSTLKHPNIAQLLDGGISSGGLSYFVMEYVDGNPLNQYCNENGLSLNERLEIFLKICAAVDHAHKNLIVHRDLKPSNVLVITDGIPKLLDFGIAKLMSNDGDEATVTETRGRVFTPEYASPEQILGKPVTTATDIYSLGVLLYEILSGHRPFSNKGKSYEEMVKNICETDPPAPSQAVTREQTNTNTRNELNPLSPNLDRGSLCGDLDNIILKSIRKEPSERYGSVQQFADDISRFLQGLPVLARPQTINYLFGKYFKRHKAGVLAGILVLLSLVGGISVATWQAVVANRERQKAENRLIEIRNVAKSLMNETNDSLAKIPGNVVVQKALVEKSVALLDSLANEETNDSILLAELAEAYTKLANIQTWSFREFVKSSENILKAENIYRKILQFNPDNINIRAKLYSTQMRRIESLHDTNFRPEMFQVGLAAIENLKEMGRIEPENPSNFVNLAAMYGWFGDKHSLFGRNDEAVKNYRLGLEIIDQEVEKQSFKGNSADEKAELVRLQFVKGWLLKGAGETAKAIEIYQTSVEIAKSVYLENPEIEWNFGRILSSYDRIAEIYEEENNYQKALESYQMAQFWVTEGEKNKLIPEYNSLLYYKCFYLVYSGKMSDKLTKKLEAQKYFSQGELICRQNIAQDINDKANVFESLPFLFEIFDFYSSYRGRSQALSGLLVLSKQFQTILKENNTDLASALALAEINEKIGDISSGSEIRDSYQKSVDIWRKYSADNSLLPNESEKMQRVLTKLNKLKTDETVAR